MATVIWFAVRERANNQVDEKTISYIVSARFGR